MKFPLIALFIILTISLSGCLTGSNGPIGISCSSPKEVAYNVQDSKLVTEAGSCNIVPDDLNDIPIEVKRVIPAGYKGMALEENCPEKIKTQYNWIFLKDTNENIVVCLPNWGT